VTTTTDDVIRLVEQLPDVTMRQAPEWTSLKVAGRTFGYVWEQTQTVGLKQTIVEQLALVSERPDVFEKQFTAGQFGWVVVHCDRIDADELAELVFEAWRLTAPAELVEDRGDKLPA
jgi:hypothetical protein